MTKPLADMTAEERSECVGMWCEVDGQLEILAAPDGMVDYHDTVIMHSVKRNGGGYVLAKNVTPRFDLPRAWTPDGEPVPGEWEDGHVFVSYDDPDPWIVKDTVSIEGLSEGGMSYYQEPPNGIAVELDQFGEGEGKARRWVGEWEKTNE